MEPPVNGDIGGRLRRAREERGLTLRDTAQRTKLSIAVLQAIERNDFARLPAGMFRKAYVRTLAGEVGLDPGALAADYRARYEPAIEASAAPDRDAALQRRRIEQLTPSPSVRRSVAALAPLVAMAAAWFMLTPRPAGPRAPGDAAGGVIAARMPPVTSRALTGDAAPDAAPALAEKRPAPLWIEVEAIGWCWIAAETDGERALYRLVEPGERLVFEGRRMISLRFGDAGAVTLSINDGPARAPGRDGEVVELDVTADNVERLRELAAETVSGRRTVRSASAAVLPRRGVRRLTSRVPARRRRA